MEKRGHKTLEINRRGLYHRPNVEEKLKICRRSGSDDTTIQ